MSASARTILLVEDNDDDVFLMKRALKEASIKMPVQVATDGREAINYLGGIGKYADRQMYPLPSYVFLDLKLPYKSGFEVFSWIREQKHLGDMAIIILTSSAEPRDRDRATQLKAHAYLVKPPGATQLSKILNSAP